MAVYCQSFHACYASCYFERVSLVITARLHSTLNHNVLMISRNTYCLRPSRLYLIKTDHIAQEDFSEHNSLFLIFTVKNTVMCGASVI